MGGEATADISVSYAAWAKDQGLNTGPQESVAGDGVPNLLKYALGLDPPVPAPASLLPSVEMNEEEDEAGIRSFDEKSARPFFYCPTQWENDNLSLFAFFTVIGHFKKVFPSPHE
ncbi:MAG: hypothetical protein WD490_10375 [Opitutales bacterium]